MELPEIVRAAIERSGFLKVATDWEPHRLDLSDDFKALMPNMAELLLSTTAFSAVFPPLGNPDDPDCYVPERRSIMLFWETADEVEWFGLSPERTPPHADASEALAIFIREVGCISNLPPHFHWFGNGEPVSRIDYDNYFDALDWEIEDEEEDHPELAGTLLPFPLAESLLVGKYNGCNLVVEHNQAIRTVSAAEDGLIFDRIGAENDQFEGSNTIYASDEIRTFQQLAERVAAIALRRYITPEQKEFFFTDKEIDLDSLDVPEHVEHVWFGRCTIDGVLNGKVGNPDVLRHLDFRGSTFSSEGPFAGLSLPALEQLWLFGMTAATPFPLSECPNLQCLWLTASSAIDEFSGLRFPNLVELKIDKPTPESIFPLAASPELKELYLTNGQLDDEWVREIAALKRLTRLHLTDSPISGSQLERLVSCRSLKGLDLSGTGLGDVDAAALSHLTHLEILWIGSTAITEAAFCHLEALPLRHLSCRAFGKAGLRSLQKMESLESLTADVPLKDRLRKKLEAGGVRVYLDD